MRILLMQYLIEMTKVRLILFLAFTLLLSSCLEIKETYTLQENGSYAMEYSVDVSNMIILFQSMSEEAPAELSAFKVVDTMINYDNIFPDSVKKYVDSKTLSLLTKTNFYLKMDMANGAFLTKINSQGSSISDLETLLKSYDDILNLGEEKIMNSFIFKTRSEKGYQSRNTLSNEDFEYTITPHSFERKLTDDAIEKYKGRDTANLEMILSNADIDLNIMTTLVINLPRPVKSTGNKNATLSADKKQFSLKVNLIKAAGNPELLNFKIIY